jgi:hypothetical protein
METRVDEIADRQARFQAVDPVGQVGHESSPIVRGKTAERTAADKPAAYLLGL